MHRILADLNMRNKCSKVINPNRILHIVLLMMVFEPYGFLCFFKIGNDHVNITFDTIIFEVSIWGSNHMVRKRGLIIQTSEDSW
jgi:hypothetical protein